MKKLTFLTLFWLGAQAATAQIPQPQCPYDDAFRRVDTEIVALNLSGSALSKDFLRTLSSNSKTVACHPAQSFIGSEKTLLALYCKLLFLLDLPTTSAADQDHIRRAVQEIIQLKFDFHRRAPDPAGKRPWRRRRGDGDGSGGSGCTVEIFLRDNHFLVSLGSKLFVRPNEILDLDAEGRGSGGTYSWETDPSAGSAFSAFGNRATLVAQKLGETEIRVLYTAPDGNRCLDKLRVEVGY